MAVAADAVGEVTRDRQRQPVGEPARAGVVHVDLAGRQLRDPQHVVRIDRQALGPDVRVRHVEFEGLAARRVKHAHAVAVGLGVPQPALAVGDGGVQMHAFLAHAFGARRLVDGDLAGHGVEARQDLAREMRHPDAAARVLIHVTVGVHHEVLHVAALLEAVVDLELPGLRVEADHLLRLGERDPQQAVARDVDLVRAARLAGLDVHRQVVGLHRAAVDVDPVQLVAEVVGDPGAPGGHRHVVIEAGLGAGRVLADLGGRGRDAETLFRHLGVLRQPLRELLGVETDEREVERVVDLLHARDHRAPVLKRCAGGDRRAELVAGRAAEHHLAADIALRQRRDPVGRAHRFGDRFRRGWQAAGKGGGEQDQGKHGVTAHGVLLVAS